MPIDRHRKQTSPPPDADQTASDADRGGSERDEDDARSDQRWSDRDQASADRRALATADVTARLGDQPGAVHRRGGDPAGPPLLCRHRR
jgi:hypothetical protein